MDNRMADGEHLKKGAMRQPNSSINRHIGSRLHTLRRKLRLSQSEAAAILGVSYQQQQKYEKGSVRLSAAALHLLAERLDVNVGYFFEGLGPSAPARGLSEETTGYTVDTAATSDAERLDQAFARLRSQAARAQAIALVELVANNFEGDRQPSGRALPGSTSDTADDTEAK